MIKTPIEYVPNLYSEDPSFCAISGFNAPSDSSFYLSLGAGILESLVRLKLRPRYGDFYWDSLIKNCIDALSESDEKKTYFLNFLEAIRNAELNDATEWLACFLTKNQQGAVDLLEHGMKKLLDYLSPQIPGQSKWENALNAIEQHLRISVFVASEGQAEFCNGREGNILICLYRNGDHDEFSVLYHEDHLFVDKNLTVPEGGILRFPFLYLSSRIAQNTEQNQRNERSQQNEGNQLNIQPSISNQDSTHFSSKEKLVLKLVGKILYDNVSDQQLSTLLDEVFTENPNFSYPKARILRDSLSDN